MSRAWLAIKSEPGQIRLIDTGCDSAGHCKRTELQELRRIVLVINDWAHHVRAVKSVSSTAIVIFKVVIKRKRLATLQRNGTVHTPAITQPCPATAHLGKFKSCNPDETLWNIEVRSSIFALRIIAVLRLRRIHDEVFAIARIVQRLRPHIVDD